MFIIRNNVSESAESDLDLQSDEEYDYSGALQFEYVSLRLPYQ